MATKSPARRRQPQTRFPSKGPGNLMATIQDFLREKGYEVGDAPLRFGSTVNPNALAESGDEIVVNERDQHKFDVLADIYANQHLKAGENRLNGTYDGDPDTGLTDSLQALVHEAIHQHKGSPYKRHQAGDYPDREGVDSFLEEATTEAAARDITPALLKRLYGEARPGTMANLLFSQRAKFGRNPGGYNAMPGDKGTKVGADVPRDKDGRPVAPAMTDIASSPYAEGVGAMRLRSLYATGQGANTPAARHWRRNLANAQGQERPLMLQAADANKPNALAAVRRPNTTNRTPMTPDKQLARIQSTPTAPTANSSAGSGLTPPRLRRLRPNQGRPS